MCVCVCGGMCKSVCVCVCAERYANRMREGAQGRGGEGKKERREDLTTISSFSKKLSLALILSLSALIQFWLCI